MSLTRNNQRKVVLENWVRLGEAADVMLKAQIGHAFAQLRRAACEAMAEDAAQFSRLGDNDELVYDRLTRLMTAYREVVELVENAPAAAPAVKKLLAGICDVLVSRLGQFEEMEKPETEGNPVAKEKRGILDRALSYTNKQIETQATHFPDNIASEVWTHLRGFFIAGDTDAWQKVIRTQIRLVSLEEMFMHYQDGLRFCLQGLDDLHGRKTAHFYIDLIEREWEVLEHLIRVQVKALEDASPNNFGVVTLLQEAYQQTGPLVKDIRDLLQAGARQASQCRPFEAFTDAMHFSFNSEADAVPDSAAFGLLLTDEVNYLFEQQRVAYLKVAYGFQRRIGEEILLAEEASALFSAAFHALQDEEIRGEETEAQIINGIVETLEIKIDSLKDSIYAFNSEGAKVLHEFAKEKSSVNEEVKQAAAKDVLTLWLETPPRDITRVHEFFKNCQKSEIFIPHREQHEKQVVRYREKIEKMTLRFCKEIVLYEVGTYEEILTHSVSRLRESLTEAVQAAALLLDDTYTALEVLLKKNNIIPIRPEPHEAFNGKEHEVLVAEKQIGFAKGEIIKRVGSGYRQKDVVLMRANVIAAK